MWRTNRIAELERAIADVRAAFGDGPYLLLSQRRELDIDGYTDSLALIASYADRGEADAALAREFVALCEHAHDEPHWRDESGYSLPVTIEPADGVRLVMQLWRKRKDPSGFNADTIAVQLLEIAPPPIIGEPLFRALCYADELVQFLLR